PADLYLDSGAALGAVREVYQTDYSRPNMGLNGADLWRCRPLDVGWGVVICHSVASCPLKENRTYIASICAASSANLRLIPSIHFLAKRSPPVCGWAARAIRS